MINSLGLIRCEVDVAHGGEQAKCATISEALLLTWPGQCRRGCLGNISGDTQKHFTKSTVPIFTGSYSILESLPIGIGHHRSNNG